MSVEIKVPDIGDFSDVEIIEVLVKEGDEIAVDDALITLETDKASMEVPATGAGKVEVLKVKVGDRVSKGDVIVALAAAGGSVPQATPAAAKAPSPSAPSAGGTGDGVDLVVLGSGPGGYTAAFRAADLGLNVTLVERYASLGGVCLNVGCIPSKALLHAAKVIAEARDMAEHGVSFGKPKIDLDTLADWKDGVVGRLTGGLSSLAKKRKVKVVQGVGMLTGANELSVDTGDSTEKIAFKQAIIAAGSEPVTLPFIPHDDPRIIDSTGALELDDVPKRLLILGGGIIGLEMATVYRELGAKITVVELMDQIIPGADKDIVAPLLKRIQRLYENIYLGTKVTAVDASSKKALKVTFEGGKAPAEETFDKILVAVGRRPLGHTIGADAAGVDVNERGFIEVDSQQRTNVPHIFAIGDVVGQPMLAHKATHEAKVAAEVAAGQKSHFDAKVIPSVAYTDPEIAWVGLTETEAKEKGIKVGKGVFPWAASGRALGIARAEGLTKLLFDPETDLVLGAGIVGSNAGDLIAEVGLAIEMGADAQDIGLTIHPHPTLSETVAMSAEAFEGSITDLYLPKKR